MFYKKKKHKSIEPKNNVITLKLDLRGIPKKTSASLSINLALSQI